MHCCIIYVLQAHTYMNYKVGMYSFQITQSHIYLQFPFAFCFILYILSPFVCLQILVDSQCYSRCGIYFSIRISKF